MKYIQLLFSRQKVSLFNEKTDMFHVCFQITAFLKMDIYIYIYML